MKPSNPLHHALTLPELPVLVIYGINAIEQVVPSAPVKSMYAFKKFVSQGTIAHGGHIYQHRVQARIGGLWQIEHRTLNEYWKPQLGGYDTICYNRDQRTQYEGNSLYPRLVEAYGS